jgi:hypothetical protein
MQLVAVRHPDTGRDTLTLSIKFAHHAPTTGRSRPIFYFTPTRRLVFCLVTLIASIASPTLNASVDAVFGAGVSGPVSHTPL